MTAVNSGSMSLSPEQLNDLDEWILDYLGEHEWATPNLMQAMHADETGESKSRQWFSDRLIRLGEHDHVEYVHEDASERRLVSDPREGDE